MEEIAAEVGISKEDIVYALDAMQNPMSLYEPVYTDGGDTLYVMDQISDKKNKEETWVEHLSLSEAMKRLNDRERHIISLRFFEGKTQTEVADMIGISQAQVSRLEKNALRQITAHFVWPFNEAYSLVNRFFHSQFKDFFRGFEAVQVKVINRKIIGII